MNKKKILIVEDEESLLKLESLLLSAKGYSVTGVSDGKAALDEIALNKPDLVILDVMIQELDGYQVWLRIKENTAKSSIPVVMLTARKTQEDVESGEKAGADAYIIKPFKAAAIIDTI